MKSQLSLQTLSNQLSQKVKSLQYKNSEYKIFLEQKSSYMCEYDDIDDNNKGENMKTLCKTLLKNDQTSPQNSLFCDDLFKKTCEKVWNRNKVMLI